MWGYEVRMNFMCVICYGNMAYSEQILSTICGHLFHKSCMNIWLQGKNSCPHCRTLLDEENALVHLKLMDQVKSSDQKKIDMLKKLHDLECVVLDKEIALRKSQEQEVQMQLELQQKAQLIADLERKIRDADSTLAALEQQLELVNAQSLEAEKAFRERSEN
ncbi:hypothetical protein ACJJTC_005131 [Scirpophaga incertulas]